MLDTKPLLLKTDFPPLRRGRIHTLQVNLGYVCNLSCTHCHVNAGPKRTELMSRETMDEVLAYIDNQEINTLDITGGAPEMNPHFRDLIKLVRARDVLVTDRCNLTILQEPGYEDLAQFLAEYQVNIVASLPCYSEQNVNEQRGKGVYQSSIDALKTLNVLGYGSDPNLQLDLVYNPAGAFLPPSQQCLETDYKKALANDHSIVFNHLLTITNMPISRFGSMLLSKGLYNDYMQLLKDSFSSENLQSVMCRSLLSIDWEGYVYDCDFNQMLAMPMQYQTKHIASDKPRTHLRELINTDLQGMPIVIGDHCYGCTAGQGSSCGGALE
ncbi:radical SAM protein [Candidatus Endobugula sertula]|uniref:Radical SAM protein n=1 Tax=Candidatus Endobugula sertula TaxID=62101 RepID=A0A1D2QNX4_9GAMM|nr:radical SAM protein [Candidatus Endobugula sertula]